MPRAHCLTSAQAFLFLRIHAMTLRLGSSRSRLLHAAAVDCLGSQDVSCGGPKSWQCRRVAVEQFCD